jgi:hypothetical protein
VPCRAAGTTAARVEWDMSNAATFNAGEGVGATGVGCSGADRNPSGSTEEGLGEHSTPEIDNLNWPHLGPE